MLAGENGKIPKADCMKKQLWINLCTQLYEMNSPKEMGGDIRIWGKG